MVVEILKWVGIVFAAGFIGYFGRYLSMLLIERLRRKRAQSVLITEVAQESFVASEPARENAQLKLAKQKAKVEKKKAKADVKRAKKRGGG
ncbi:MAG: hypothetical protein QF594_05380 [Dehalococcoidales bacterium]|nr:hypothetical protein [Dehalococcoidales bacterium]